MTFLRIHNFSEDISLYIFGTGPGKQYFVAALTTPGGPQYLYLGKALDKEAGIYKNAARGIFKFDCTTGDISAVPENFMEEKTPEKKIYSRVSVDFGDSFFLNEFLYKSGMMSIVDQLDCKNLDTLHAMILFYTLSSISNSDATYWYKGNIVSLLYPNANLSSQRISEFLAEIGKDENRIRFQIEYIKHITKYYDKDKNILVDSTGLPNSINFRFTRKNIHNGKLSNEIRLIFVVQKSTGLPLFYYVVPGNVVDVNTLETIFYHLEAMDIDIDSCILDAGFNSCSNYDLFYDLNSHQKKIGFIIRIKSNFKQYNDIIKESLEDLEKRENLVKYEDRYLFVIKKQIFVGSENKNPAWIYLGLDIARKNDEYKSLVKKAKNKNLSNDDVFAALQSEGLFGILSNLDISCEEILPAYYQRQAAEQIFDFAKNYTKLLPLRICTEDTFQGHLLLSYIATCSVKLIQLRLKVANLFYASRLVHMRNQKCTIYKNFIIPDVAPKEVNEVYKCFNILYPKRIPFEGRTIKYAPPSIDIGAIIPKAQQNTSHSPLANSTVIAKSTVQSVSREEQPNIGEIPASANDEDGSHLKQLPRMITDPQPVKRGRGRPLGSKNKKTLEREAKIANEPQPVKRGRGRPLGSKNKKTLEREAKMREDAAS